MNNNDYINDELNELNSNLSRLDNPLSVPEGYFEGLRASVMARIKDAEETAAGETENLSPLLAGISRKMPFEVPANYFATNLADLPLFVKDEQPSLLLSSIPKQMPNELPVGYFNNLPANIIRKIVPVQAKILPITQRKWMRLAVAAVVAGVITLSGYFYFSQGGGFDPAKPIAGQLKNVSTTELDEFINTTDISSASAETVSNKNNELKGLFEDVSDSELDAFLNQVPTEDDDL